MITRIPWKLILACIACLVIIITTLVIRSKLSGDGSITVRVDRPAVIKQIRSLARLETASFTIEQIIDAQTNETGAIQKFLFGDKILLVAHGQVIAGFDLSQISDADVEIKNTEIKIMLPQPQVLVATLDNSKTRVYDRKQGIFRKNDTDLESTARSEAEKAILKAACDGGILEVASENAKRQIASLLTGFGFETVIVSIPAGTTCKV